MAEPHDQGGIAQSPMGVGHHCRRTFAGMTALVGAKHLWKPVVPPKVKIFLLARPPWPPTERRTHHGLQHDVTCIICDQHDKTTDHLLASCVFTREVWFRLLSRVGMEHLALAEDSSLADRWQTTRLSIPKHLRRSFDSVVLLVSWMVWKERNRHTFDMITKSPAELVVLILEEADAWIAAGFRCLVSLVVLLA
jgi:hypothetical protein